MCVNHTRTDLVTVMGPESFFTPINSVWHEVLPLSFKNAIPTAPSPRIFPSKNSVTVRPVMKWVGEATRVNEEASGIVFAITFVKVSGCGEEKERTVLICERLLR